MSKRLRAILQKRAIGLKASLSHRLIPKPIAKGFLLELKRNRISNSLRFALIASIQSQSFLG
ncbi:MAG: hypothetical protein CMI17_02350 [Opitutaceae bacterium]|nr:hypothetical protein [Opitutaceae bacterium]